jgi:hypothetical protein
MPELLQFLYKSFEFISVVEMLIVYYGYYFVACFGGVTTGKFIPSGSADALRCSLFQRYCFAIFFLSDL